jgi:hypothetical protein
MCIDAELIGWPKSGLGDEPPRPNRGCCVTGSEFILAQLSRIVHRLSHWKNYQKLFL